MALHIGQSQSLNLTTTTLAVPGEMPRSTRGCASQALANCSCWLTGGGGGGAVGARISRGNRTTHDAVSAMYTSAAISVRGLRKTAPRSCAARTGSWATDTDALRPETMKMPSTDTYEPMHSKQYVWMTNHDA